MEAISNNLIKNIFSLVFSFPCPVCKKNLCQNKEFICKECLAEIEFVKAPFCPSCGADNDGILEFCRNCLREDSREWQKAMTLMRFQGLSKELIHRFKYNNDTALARFFGYYAAEKLKSENIKPDIIVPVPLHWLNYLIRGYNQSFLFARFISGFTGIPVSEALKRQKWTKKQAKLDKKGRRKNIEGAFSIRNHLICQNKSVLLVDDVFTTGATLSAAARPLKEAGVDVIYVLTLARD